MSSWAWRVVVAASLVPWGCGGEVDARARNEAATEPAPLPLVSIAEGERVIGLVVDGDTLAWVRRVADGSARVERQRGASPVEVVGAIAHLPDDFAASIPSVVVLAGDDVRFIDPEARRVHVGADVALDDEPVGLAKNAAGTTFVLMRTKVARVDAAGTTTLATLDERARPCRIDADDTHVWFGEVRAWRVSRVPIVGGAREIYALQRRLACGVVVDAERATWVDVDPTLRVFVTRFAKRELPPPDVIPAASTEVGYYTPGGFLVDLAAYGGFALTANAEDGNVVEVDLSRTEKRVLVAERAGLSSVAMGEAGRFYADARGIWRLGGQ